MRLSELDELHEQALRHARNAEQIGFLDTARALRLVAQEIEQERRELLASNPLRLKPQEEPQAAEKLSGAGAQREHRSAG